MLAYEAICTEQNPGQEITNQNAWIYLKTTLSTIMMLATVPVIAIQLDLS